MSWLEELFEYEDCEECHGGTKDHIQISGPFGLPFALCNPSYQPIADPESQ